MATQQHHFAQQQLTRERRRKMRVAPALLTYVSFGGSNGGMVLDVSEDGMALATAFAIPDASLLDISIPADPAHELIEVTGRVAWIAASKRRLGVRLVGAPPRTQEVLRSWISAVRGTSKDGRENIDDETPHEQTVVTDVAKDAVSPRSVGTPPAAPQPFGKQTFAAQLIETQPTETQPAATPPVSVSAKTDPEKPVRDANADTFNVEDDGSQAAPARQRSSQYWITKSRSVPVAAAFVMVVIGGFALGIAIGRSVLARWSNRAFSPTAAVSRPTDDVRPAVALQTTAPTAPIANSHPPGSADMDANARPAPPAFATPAPSSSDRNFSADNSSENHSSGDSVDSALPGGEIFVTPNVGDVPLRVDLGEEVIAHSPSLEIRSRRFVFVPGVATSGHHKPRKERLEVGILISRVTPQLPAPPSSAIPTQNGEQVAAVRATIAGDGHIVNVDPLNGPNTLMPGVMAAIREWRYDPSSLNGKPVETQADLTFKFRPLL